MYWARENGWEFLPIRTGRNSRIGKSVRSVYQEPMVMKTKESRKPIQQENGSL